MFNKQRRLQLHIVIMSLLVMSGPSWGADDESATVTMGSTGTLRIRRIARAGEVISYGTLLVEKGAEGYEETVSNLGLAPGKTVEPKEWFRGDGGRSLLKGITFSRFDPAVKQITVGEFGEFGYPTSSGARFVKVKNGDVAESVHFFSACVFDKMNRVSSNAKFITAYEKDIAAMPAEAKEALSIFCPGDSRPSARENLLLALYCAYLGSFNDLAPLLLRRFPRAMAVVLLVSAKSESQ